MGKKIFALISLMTVLTTFSACNSEETQADTTISEAIVDVTKVETVVPTNETTIIETTTELKEDKTIDTTVTEITSKKSTFFLTTKATRATTTAYEWKLNTSSTGYDWISVNNTEKEVWCSNSIAAWRLMGYDIPDGVSAKSMVKAIDKLYEDETYLKYDLATISEMFAIANDIY